MFSLFHSEIESLLFFDCDRFPGILGWHVVSLTGWGIVDNVQMAGEIWRGNSKVMVKRGFRWGDPVGKHVRCCAYRPPSDTINLGSFWILLIIPKEVFDPIVSNILIFNRQQTWDLNHTLQARLILNGHQRQGYLFFFMMMVAWQTLLVVVRFGVINSIGCHRFSEGTSIGIGRI